MEVNNKKYKNQGIHVIGTIFTIDKGIIKVLLIRRKNKPFNGFWALTGGALYNNEELNDGLKREIKEKTGLENIEYILSNVYGELNRSPVYRMVAISYIGLIDRYKVEINKETLKTSDAKWFSLDEIPEKLAYDHKKILEDSISKLKSIVLDSNILKSLYPKGFTIPEIQKVYERILNKTFDRRNFRKKLLNNDYIVETNEEISFNGKKKAKVYMFK